MKLIYGSPTTGKTTYQKDMAQKGATVIDTDALIEAMILGTRGLPSTSWKEAWEWWKGATREERAPIEASVRALVERWRATLGDHLTVTTNLHWKDMKPDMAFGRAPEDIVTIKRRKYESEGRELTPEDAERMMGWRLPTDLGTKIELLPDGEFISDRVQGSSTKQLLNLIKE